MPRDIATEVTSTVKSIPIAQDVWRKLQMLCLLKGESVVNVASDLLDRALDGSKDEVKELMKDFYG